MFHIPLSESSLQPFFRVQSKKSKRGIRRQGLHNIDCVVCIPLSPLGTIDQTQIQDDGLFAPRGDTEHRPPQTNRRANGPKDADLRYGASPSTSSFSQYHHSSKVSRSRVQINVMEEKEGLEKSQGLRRVVGGCCLSAQSPYDIHATP